MNPSGAARQGVFISYARADGEAVARALQERLRLDSPDVPSWLDRLELEGGVGWWSQIEQQLDRVEFLIIVMTPAAMRSANTRREWRAARQRGVCVYPIKGVADAALDYAGLPGWMQKAHFYDPEIEWPKLVAHLRRGCQATRVPFMAPSLAAGVIDRPHESLALLQALLPGAGASRLIALRGAGGYGKTTLAAAVCHEDAVIEAFDDGILWVTLGQTPNLLNELIKLYAALTGERPGFVDAEDAARELALKLENKNCLIVIDDVWKGAHALPFLRGGTACTRLITTRLAEVAPQAQRVPVERMAPDEALGLLLARLGSTPAGLPAFEALVLRLGGWPLPIKLAGSMMRRRVERGETADDALAHVVRVLDKRGIVAFDERDSDERSGAVARTIEASLTMLTPAEHQRCIELAVFAEDTAIPMAVAATLWQLDELDTEDVARRLDDMALVEFDLRRGTLQLHDVLRGFLAGQLGDAGVIHARLLDAWGDALAPKHDYAWRAYASHLLGAGRAAELDRLLLDIHWLEAKLRATDIHAVIADFGPGQSSPALRVLADALRLSAPALAGAPAELRSQLVGRLLGRDEPGLAEFVRAASTGCAQPWLRPLQATLDAPGGMLQMTLVGHTGEVTSLAADRDFGLLLSGASDGTARLWNGDDGKLVASIDLPGPAARVVAAFTNDTFGLAGNALGRLHLLNLQTHERAARLTSADRSAITALAVAADGRIGVCASRDGRLRVWDIAQRTLLRDIAAHKERATCVAISADGARAVSGSYDGTVRVWNLELAGRKHTLAGHADAVNGVALTPDGRLAVSGGSDGKLIVWDVDAGHALKILSGHSASVTAVAVSADGRRALSGSSDTSARLWDLDSGRTLAVLEGHADTVNAVVISADATRAATGSADRGIKLWRLDARQGLGTTDAHTGAVTCLVWSPDGQRFASGGADGRILVRELATGHVLRVIAANAEALRSLAFTEDGQCVLSGSIDSRYVLWAVDSGEPYAMPVRHLAPISHCAFSSVARYLVTACRDHFVYVWDVPGVALTARYGTRRLFDHLIAPAPRRRELPASDELLDAYLPGETKFEVVVVRMSADGRNALLSATARETDSQWIRARAARAATDPAATPETPGSCLLVFELATGGVRTVVSTQAEAISAFAVDTSGTRALWARSDHGLELWDLDANQRIALLEGHTEKVNALAFGPHDDLAFSCARDRTLRAWDLQTGRQIASFTADAALRSLALDPQGATVLVGDMAGRVHALRLDRAGTSAAMA